MNGNKILKRVIILVLMLISTSAIFCILWSNGNFLPGWIIWENEELCDRSGEYKVLLENKSVDVIYDNSVIWSTQDDIKVQKVLSSDVDNDKNDELVLLCWKVGRYGKHRPFWIDKDEKKWSQVFLDSGVDVVIGTHPHVLQPYEILKDDNGHEMLIFYSIGNYISAQSEKSCIKGGMASFTVSLTKEGYKITEYNLQPLMINWNEGGKYSVEF